MRCQQVALSCVKDDLSPHRLLSESRITGSLVGRLMEELRLGMRSSSPSSISAWYASPFSLPLLYFHRANSFKVRLACFQLL